MSRSLPLALAQAAELPATAPTGDFAAEVEALLARHPRTLLAVYPELHACGTTGTREALEEVAEPLHGPRTKALAELAGDLGIWLLPGTVCERGDGGELFNTAPVFSPQGELITWYRKIFPWRPHEPFDPGERFVVFDVPDAGRVGLSVCYDSWFPEVARHLAWMGAEVIVNPVRTTTPDREQELVLARAHAITNQVFVASVNAADAPGVGGSILVDPEGRVRAQAEGSAEAELTDVLDLDEVTRVREHGTCGLNRMWAQFTDQDPAIPLPLYDGRIDPHRWAPRGRTPRPADE